MVHLEQALQDVSARHQLERQRRKALHNSLVVSVGVGENSGPPRGEAHTEHAGAPHRRVLGRGDSGEGDSGAAWPEGRGAELRGL